jgi:hypothetical protein
MYTWLLKGHFRNERQSRKNHIMPKSFYRTISILKWGKQLELVMYIPVIRQKSISNLPYHFVPYLLHTDLWFSSSPPEHRKESGTALKWSIHNKGAKTNLYDINRASIWIPVSVDDNPIITFIYEMCTSTDVIHIRRCPIPVVKLLKT